MVVKAGGPSGNRMHDLNTIIADIAEAGRRLAQIGASDGAAGNISSLLGRGEVDSRDYPLTEPLAVPHIGPELARCVFVVTGSGRRLREIGDDPSGNLALVTFDESGERATLHTSPRRRFERLTVEFNSHLAVHRDHIRRDSLDFHAIIHAQPLNLTYLSHIPAYRDERHLNRRILRWEPESIYHLREGVAVIPFFVPASQELGRANVEAMRSHHVALWSKHGIMARSEVSVKRACDLIEYAEVGARFERLNLAAGEPAEGLTDDEIRLICSTFGVEQDIF